MPFVPEYNASLAIIKVFDLGDSGTLTPRLDYAYRDDVLFTADNDPDNSQDSHSIVNANISWNSPRDKYAMTLYLNNITDEETIKYTDIAGSNAAGVDLLGRGFEWYLSAEMKF